MNYVKLLLNVSLFFILTFLISCETDENEKGLDEKENVGIIGKWNPLSKRISTLSNKKITIPVTSGDFSIDFCDNNCNIGSQKYFWEMDADGETIHITDINWIVKIQSESHIKVFYSDESVNVELTYAKQNSNMEKAESPYHPFSTTQIVKQISIENGNTWSFKYDEKGRVYEYREGTQDYYHIFYVNYVADTVFVSNIGVAKSEYGDLYVPDEYALLNSAGYICNNYKNEHSQEYDEDGYLIKFHQSGYRLSWDLSYDNGNQIGGSGPFPYRCTYTGYLNETSINLNSFISPQVYGTGVGGLGNFDMKGKRSTYLLRTFSRGGVENTYSYELDSQKRITKITALTESKASDPKRTIDRKSVV